MIRTDGIGQESTRQHASVGRRAGGHGQRRPTARTVVGKHDRGHVLVLNPRLHVDSLTTVDNNDDVVDHRSDSVDKLRSVVGELEILSVVSLRLECRNEDDGLVDVLGDGIDVGPRRGVSVELEVDSGVGVNGSVDDGLKWSDDVSEAKKMDGIAVGSEGRERERGLRDERRGEDERSVG